MAAQRKTKYQETTSHSDYVIRLIAYFKEAAIIEVNGERISKQRGDIAGGVASFVKCTDIDYAKQKARELRDEYFSEYFREIQILKNGMLLFKASNYKP